MSEITNSATIKVVVDGSQAEVGLRKIDEASAKTGRNLENLGKNDGFDKTGAGAEAAARKVDAATRSAVNAIEREIAALKAGSKANAEYQEFRARQRGADPKVLEPYLAQLRAMEATQKAANVALGAASPVLNNVGMSAKATAAALRGVPAQFTDIVTSIQGGQAPLTVFLQQGGQLKDMFGGAGNAARALGGYVVGLINPLTIAAAAAGALAIAYNQGSKEADAYNRALIITGNAAGVTAGQLADMSARISTAAGTQGQAAAAVAAIADTGRVSASNIERFSKVAADSQRVLGIAVGDTAKAFADLGKNPVAALERLNETYRFLTPAVYEQVKALEAQGRADEAASAAQAAFASAMETRTKGVKDNLGALETAWKGLGEIASGTWDKMLNIGRKDTLTEQLAAVQKQIDKAQKSASKPFDASFGGNAEVRAQLAANLKIEASLKGQIKLETEAAAAASATNKQWEAGLEWSKEGDKYLSKTKKMELEVAAARNVGAIAGKSQEEIEKRIAAIREKYVDKKIDAAINKEASAYATLTSSIKERIAATASEASGQGALTESQKLRVALDEQLSSGKLKLTAAHKAEYLADLDTLAVNESIISARKLRLKFEGEAFKLAQERADASARTVTAAENEADKNEELARTYGMTKGAIEALELARLEEQLSQQVSIAVTEKEIETRERLEKLIDAKRRSAAALSSVDTQEATKKANKAMTDEWEKTVDKYEDVFRTGFADMLNNGKDGWRSFTKSLATTFKTSVADQIYKMFAKPFVMNLVASLIGVTGGASVANAADLIGGGGGGASGISGIVSSAQAAYGAISAGFTGIATTVADTVQAAMYASGASPTLLTNGSFATGAGVAASYLGGAAAGVYGGRALSNGYAISGSGNGLVNAGTAVGAIVAGPIGAAIGGLIAGAANRLFGMKAKEVTSTTLNGAFGENGLTGTTDAAFIQKGGVFRSDKKGVDSTAIDAATAKQFGAGYDAIKAASSDFAKVLGLNADSIANRTQSLSIAITKDEEANKKAISDFFTGVGNTIANELLPTLGDFAKEGEGASATLQRLATNYATIDAALSSIGLLFGAVGADSLTARERLVDLSGGIQALTQNAAGFAQNFLTESDRLAPVAAAVSKAMGDLGFSMVDTREEFKALVLGLDLTTEAGARNYAELMKLQGAFAEVAKASEVAAEATIAAAKASADAAIEARERAIEAVKTAASGLLGSVDDSFSVMQRIANAEKDRATKAHEVTMKRLQSSIDLETEAVAKRRALSDSVNSTLSQRGTGLDRNGAQAQIQAAIAIAKASGVLPSADSLKEALSVLSRDSGDTFATLQDQLRAEAQTQNSLAELGKLSDAALSVEERTLKALEDQKAAAQSAYEAQIASIDSMVSAQQEQIDALKGLDTRGLTIEQAIEGVRLAILAAQGNAFSGSTKSINDAYKSALGRAPDAAGLEYFKDRAAAGSSVSEIVAAIKNSPEAKAQDLYKSLLGRSGDAGGIAYWTQALASGMSLDAARDAFMQSDEYKKPRGFAVGTNYVPANMPAMLHEGERVIPAADNRELMQALRDPNANSQVLAAAVDLLTKAVNKLEAANASTSTSSAKVAELLDNISGGGGPLLVEFA
ncbi:phage tail length tape measure family protein [Massilia soli]|uniref:Phage tail length tape measure family protein n=1 Tax=Massilia soli TaxID=2792854 RepID=A0ABS7SR98_9BURK|nr:phage tail length tape measure family protein [Massilia soli]MBZ2208469.1 phage tail length tape measure family protein [Massilia soli]